MALFFIIMILQILTIAALIYLALQMNNADTYISNIESILKQIKL